LQQYLQNIFPHSKPLHSTGTFAILLQTPQIKSSLSSSVYFNLKISKPSKRELWFKKGLMGSFIKLSHLSSKNSFKSFESCSMLYLFCKN